MADPELLHVVRRALDMAADARVKKVSRKWGVDGDRRDLALKLLDVHSLLADAEAKAKADTEAGRAVKAWPWMEDLSAAAYQADDVLDVFHYEALRREAQSRQSIISSMVLDYFIRNQLVFRHKATRDLKNVLRKIVKLLEDMKKFDLLPREPVEPSADLTETDIVLDKIRNLLEKLKKFDLLQHEPLAP